MPKFTYEEICKATGGRIVNFDGSATELSVCHVESISTDTRTIEKGALFVALKGERFDGHRFIQAAADKGATLFLVSEHSSMPAGVPFILVADTTVALGDIARFYRRRLGCKVIGVTGSVGKTSTRRMIESVFEKSMKTYATAANNNNEIGLPLTILSAPEDVELIILEMGMRLKGEISYLTHIALPDIAVISHVGVAHIERLGSKKAILEAKLEICEGLINEKMLVINGDDTMLTEYLLQSRHRSWSQLGVAVTNASEENEILAALSANESVKLCSVNYLEDGTDFTLDYRSSKDNQSLRCRLNVVGQHQVKNALLAILCAMHLQIPAASIIDGLARLSVLDGRGKLIKIDQYSIYDDAYNAGPESMTASFESLKQWAPNARRVAAIGGMLELGDYAEAFHYESGVAAAKSGLSLIVVCGPNRNAFLNGVLSVSEDIEVILCEDKMDVLNVLADSLKPGDALLIKASHSFGFDTLAKEVVDKLNEKNAESEAGE